MPLLRKKKEIITNDAPIAETVVERSIVAVLRFTSPEQYGHADIQVSSENLDYAESLYKIISEHIGQDYIIEFATNNTYMRGIDTVPKKYHSIKQHINLKFYAYVTLNYRYE